ncbi:MAG: response regulator [Elusimicrobia bacterium]|nr:response regulator [Elusimicrobiota bacterium]
MTQSPKKILIFEDNPNIQALLRIFFQKRGYEVFFSDDGSDALALVQDLKPSLVLMDIIMPGVDGLEALKELREGGVAIPVVILSSKDSGEDKKRCLAAGANAYLIKPFNPKELEQTIKTFLS